MSIKIIIHIVFILLFTTPLFAQNENEKQKGYDPTNFFTGGSVSIGAGNSARGTTVSSSIV
jgi:hypothetical protein